MSVKPVAWLIHYDDLGGGPCIYDRYEPIASALSVNPGLRVEPLYSAPAPELAEALQNLVRAYESVVRGEFNDVYEKVNPEFYAAVSLLARITPK